MDSNQILRFDKVLPNILTTIGIKDKEIINDGGKYIAINDDENKKMERFNYSNNMMNLWKYWKQFFTLAFVISKDDYKFSYAETIGQRTDEQTFNKICLEYTNKGYFTFNNEDIFSLPEFGIDTENFAVVEIKKSNKEFFELANKNIINTFVFEFNDCYHLYFQRDQYTEKLTIENNVHNYIEILPIGKVYSSANINVLPNWLFNMLVNPNNKNVEFDEKGYVQYDVVEDENKLIKCITRIKDQTLKTDNFFYHYTDLNQWLNIFNMLIIKYQRSNIKIYSYGSKIHFI